MTRHRTRNLLRALSIGAALTVVATALAQGASADAAGTTRTVAAPVMTRSHIVQSTPRQLFPGGLTVQRETQASQVVADLLAQRKPAEAAAIKTLAVTPTAVWLGDWYSDSQLVATIASVLKTAQATRTTPTFVTYAIPNRDCGGYSSGGLTAAQYTRWNALIASTLRGHRASVIVEPDALAMLSNCPGQSATRIPLLASSVRALSSAGVATYLDAGNSHWVAPAVMADRLKRAGIWYARGFATNVSNFYTTAEETGYADRVSALTGGSHYVIDTSRNGRGYRGDWCNPAGAGIGSAPAITTGRTKLDATLWVKTPGASDGTCNGGPSAGTWWEQYALSLIRNRPAVR